jgi:uncharacterized protein YcaQ
MKCHRDTGSLTITGLWLEPGVKLSKQRQAKLEAELDRYRRFTSCAQVVWTDGAVKMAG